MLEKAPACYRDPNHKKKKKISQILGCRKWGFKRWGFKEIRGYLRKRPFSSIFWIFQVLFAPSGKSAKKGRERAKKADFGRFPGRAARHPLSPICYTPICGSPKIFRTPRIRSQRGPRTHPSRDAMLFGQRLPRKTPKSVSSHDVFRCVIAQAFCSQKSFREITLNCAKLR